MALVPQVARAGDKGILDVHDDPVHPLGSIYRDQETGFTWQYLKAGEDLELGDCVKPWHNMFAITNLANAAAAGTKELNVGSSVELLGSTSNLRHIKNRSKEKEFAMLEVVSGTGAGQIGIILDIEDHKMVVEWDSDAGTLTTALDTTSDIEIFANWFSRKTIVADEPTLAVIQQRDGVSQNKYFWGGYCVNGSIKIAEAVTRGACLNTHATDGNAGLKGDTHDYSVAVANVSLDPAASSRDIVSAMVKCALLIGEVPTRTDLGYIASTVAPAAA